MWLGFWYIKQCLFPYYPFVKKICLSRKNHKKANSTCTLFTSYESFEWFGGLYNCKVSGFDFRHKGGGLWKLFLCSFSLSKESLFWCDISIDIKNAFWPFLFCVPFMDYEQPQWKSVVASECNQKTGAASIMKLQKLSYLWLMQSENVLTMSW